MRINPVMNKELKVRMRSWKAAGMIGGYVGVLMLFVMFVLINTIMNSYYSSYGGGEFITIYAVLAIIQFALIAFIVPALTAGSIAGERERQTLDLLLCTKLSPRSIIFGKLFTSINQILLLIVAALPVFSIIFFFGGISLFQLLQLLIFYVILTITIGSIGIFCSTFIKRTTPATVLTYVFIMFLMLGTIFIAALYLLIYNRNGTVQSTFILIYLNPIAGLGSLLTSQVGASGMFNMPGLYMFTGKEIVPFWVINCIVNLFMSAVFLFLASIKLNPVKKSRNKRMKKVKNKKAVKAEDKISETP
jgi:ABC-type transport system involved in multi-copper enzyme maturation permease subunit